MKFKVVPFTHIVFVVSFGVIFAFLIPNKILFQQQIVFDTFKSQLT